VIQTKYPNVFTTFPFFLFLFCVFIATSCAAQPLGDKKQFTHQDTLRGTITPERAWWNVLRYDIQVTPDYLGKTIQGKNRITIQVLKPENKLQLDLQEPMIIDSIFLVAQTGTNSNPGNPNNPGNLSLTFQREGNAWFVTMPALTAPGSRSPPMGWRLDLDQGQTRPSLDERGLSGPGRQCLVSL